MDDDLKLGVKVGKSDTVGVAIVVGLFEDFASDGSLEVGCKWEGYGVNL